jgi:hypothetical protein
MRSFGARWVALFTALAVLLPASAFARAHYFCRMMDRVVDTCCCDADVRDESASCEPQLRSNDCCEKITAATRSAALGPAVTEFHVPPAALSATVLAAAYVVPKSVGVLTLPLQARAPPGVGPPLFIVHCSLLT